MLSQSLPLESLSVILELTDFHSEGSSIEQFINIALDVMWDTISYN